MNRDSTISRIWIITLALLTLGLQLSFGWWSVNLARQRNRSDLPHTRFLSGTVCKDELIFLMDTHPKSRNIDWTKDAPYSVDESRCNLRTGQVQVAPAPGIRHVVSDGQTLWRLPADKRVDHPIVFHGRPVDIDYHSYPYRLVEFSDGSWKESDDYPLMRYGFPGFPSHSPPTGSNEIPMVRYIRNESNVYFNPHAVVGTHEQAVKFNHEFRHEEMPIVDAGWHKSSFDRQAFSSWSRPYNLGSIALGIWVEESRVCALDLTTDAQGVEFLDIHESDEKNHTSVIRIRSPIRWSENYYGKFYLPFFDHWIKVVPAASSGIFLVSYDGRDGRIHVMKYQDGRIDLLAQRGSPILGEECWAVEPVLRFTILIPTVVLGLALWLTQWRAGYRDFPFGHERVILASAARRGIARSIDLLIPVGLLITAMVLHPDIVGWWYVIGDRCDQLSEPFFDVKITRPTMSEFASGLQMLCQDLISIPLRTWPCVIAMLYWIALIVSQARTGKTIGKWFTGMRTMRTNLRPCGFARSLLRETLLVVDSLLFLSWIPGTISILATKKSQRIGDLLSDTIVVRDLPRGTIAALDRTS